MKSEDHIFIKHLKQTLVGRLKLLLFDKISSLKDHIPDKRMIDNFVLNAHRVNQASGKLYFLLLNLNESFKVDSEDLDEPGDLTNLLITLEDIPIKKPFFIEVREQSMKTEIGILGSIDKLKDGGFVYEIWVLDDINFPENIIGYYEVRAKKDEPNPMFSSFEIGGWKHYGIDDYSSFPFLSLALKGLNYVHCQRFGSLYLITELSDLVKSENIEVLGKSFLTPPKDIRYEKLIKNANNGIVKCTEGIIRIDHVEPYDLDHCFKIPPDIIEHTIEKDIKTNMAKLLVYWNGTSFIMSDDYSAYLGFRKLKMQKIPVVIMGDFPKDIVKVVRCGGKELLPSISLQLVPPVEDYPKDLKNWLLDQKLHRGNERDVHTKLIAVFMSLSSLLQTPNVNEKRLHDFIRNNAVALDPTLIEIRSEVRLGDQYRIDLLLNYNFADKQVLLIELERSDHKLFTKAGRLTAKTTHALQQVEDWLRFWRENPNNIPLRCDQTITPEGAVVIGRSSVLSPAQKERLLHLNQNRHVKVLTYDDLLDRIKNMIDLLDKT